MSTHIQTLYQIVFSTKDRKKVLRKNSREVLFKYIWGILRNKNCYLYQINGVEDHIHILTGLDPSIALSTMVKDIKVSSNKWIKEKDTFEEFDQWQEGYAAFTYAHSSMNNLVRYIKNQEAHHRKMSYEDELRKLLMEHNVKFDEKYLL
jgi:putative transposase